MTTSTRKRPSSSGNGPRPATLEELANTRELVAVGPSGHAYRIRPLNLERHALSGGLPARLRSIALRGSSAVNELFQSDDDDELAERGREVRDYLDELVRQVVIEPDLGQAGALDLLPPIDYRWLVNVAMGEVIVDGEGEPLWGKERLSRFRGADRE